MLDLLQDVKYGTHRYQSLYTLAKQTKEQRHVNLDRLRHHADAYVAKLKQHRQEAAQDVAGSIRHRLLQDRRYRCAFR